MKETFKEQSEAFVELPDILIQDSKNAIYYFIPSAKLSLLQTESIEQRENIITFSIPNGDLIEEVNDFPITNEISSVLINDPRWNMQYLITYEDLKKYEIKTFEEVSKIIDNCLSFIIPTGDELIEDVPNLSPSMLQSNTPTTTEFIVPIQKQA